MGPRGERLTSSSLVPISFFRAVTCTPNQSLHTVIRTCTGAKTREWDEGRVKAHQLLEALRALHQVGKRAVCACIELVSVRLISGLDVRVLIGVCVEVEAPGSGNSVLDRGRVHTERLQDVEGER